MLNLIKPSALKRGNKITNVSLSWDGAGDKEVLSFYGPAILSEFSENVTMFDYTKYWVNKVLFNTKKIGKRYSSSIWTSEYLAWDEGNKNISRKTKEHKGIEVLQGNGKVKGKLIVII